MESLHIAKVFFADPIGNLDNFQLLERVKSFTPRLSMIMLAVGRSAQLYSISDGCGVRLFLLSSVRPERPVGDTKRLHTFVCLNDIGLSPEPGIPRDCLVEKYKFKVDFQDEFIGLFPTKKKQLQMLVAFGMVVSDTRNMVDEDNHSHVQYYCMYKNERGKTVYDWFDKADIEHWFEKDLQLNVCYYRVPWTSGRYDELSQSAIIYNLISGETFFFEAESASLIGALLSVERFDIIYWKLLAKNLGFEQGEVIQFLNELCEHGLITTVYPSKEIEHDYRNHISHTRKGDVISASHNVPDESMSRSNAELAYFEAVKRTGGITSVMLELTYRCSEKCIHCYNPGAVRNEFEKNTRSRFAELNLDEWKRIIDDLYEHGLVKACITGGDPFSNRDAWAILEYLYKKGVATDVYTNGQMVHEDAEKLASLYPRTVGISIYGASPEVHDNITKVPGSWAKSMRLLQQLSDLAVPLNLKCCIMRPNVKGYRGLIEVSRRLGAQPQFELNIRESNDGDICAKKLRLSKDQLQVVLMDKNIPYNLPDDLEEYKSRKCNLELNTCMIGIDDFSINPSGDVQPCVAFPLYLGNLKNHSWEEIVYNNPVLDDWQSCKMKEYDKCGEYPYCSCCKPCAGLNYIEHGDYRKAAETSCYMAKIRYELLERLNRGDDLLMGDSVDEALKKLTVPQSLVLKQEYYHKDQGVS